MTDIALEQTTYQILPDHGFMFCYIRFQITVQEIGPIATGRM